ncbi:MAG TPA: hypothetical protein VE173_15245 [Longimicrobiales bacterium]|nr:hypothetical protein [Longimicrobiales bacterium]
MKSSRYAMRGLVCAALLGGAACSDDGGVGPRDLTVVAGSYTAEGPFGAITFITTEAGSSEETDWLARGASIVLDLKADGTTGGRLYVPGADEDGGDMDEDLTGTWSLTNGRVALDHEADTFLRDMDYTLEGNRLKGEETFGGTTVRVELVRR